MTEPIKPIQKSEMDHILAAKRGQIRAIRAFDLLAASTGLVLLSPLFLVVAAAIKLDSKGPAFYEQVRIGKNEKPFRIKKFRSMRVQREASGSLLTTKGDQRVTRVGRIIRKAKIDELPQLINVAKGDMSLVGPRPEVKKYVDHYDENAKQVLRIRPGITDLASIAFFDESEILDQASDVDKVYIEEIMPIKHGLNYKYIRNMSLAYNLKVIFKTFSTILTRK